jgi:hypothetical protein
MNASLTAAKTTPPQRFALIIANEPDKDLPARYRLAADAIRKH